MGIGRGLKERRWAEPQRGQNEAAGACSQTGQPQGPEPERWRDTTVRGRGPATLTMLPRRLLPRLPVPTLALWHSASKPRIPPTPSPISTT